MATRNQTIYGEKFWKRISARKAVCRNWPSASRLPGVGAEDLFQLRRSGKMERAAGRRRGPARKITAEIEQELKDWITKQADLTVAELQLRLFEQRQFEISLSDRGRY